MSRKSARALGDRPDKPEFIETLPKRGYRFVAPVMDESGVEPTLPTLLPQPKNSPGAGTEETVGIRSGPHQTAGAFFW